MVKPTLKLINGSFLLQAQNTILSAAFILALTSGVSAFLGFVKGRLMASYFGVSDSLAVFYTADRIPNLIFSVLVVGALSTIFIPVFTHYYKKDEKEAWDTSSSMITVSVLFFLVLGMTIFILAPQVMSLLSVGKFTPGQIALGSNLMRIMLAAQLILVISSFITCVLQSFKYFLIPALSPIMYSLGLITGIVFLSSRYGIYGPAFGVVLGAFMHLIIQLPILKRVRFTYKLMLNLKDAGIREIISLMPPRILSVLIGNTISTVNNSLAILVSIPSVVYLKFADQLQFFPVTLFGVSIAAAALPTLSAESGKDQTENFKETFLTSLHQMLFLVVPASVMLLVLRIPVVRLVYGVSNFPWEATVQTAYALAFFSFSIFSQSVVYLTTRAFYALRDTKTPVLVSSVTIVINILLSLFFIRVMHWGVWAVALSFSITSLLDMITMVYLLSHKVGGFNTSAVLVPFVKISYSALLMGFSLYIPLKLLDQYIFDTTRTLNLLFLTIISAIAGVAAYLFFTKLFNVREIKLFYRLVRKLRITSEKPAAVINVES